MHLEMTCTRGTDTSELYYILLVGQLFTCLFLVIIMNALTLLFDAHSIQINYIMHAYYISTQSNLNTFKLMKLFEVTKKNIGD